LLVRTMGRGQARRFALLLAAAARTVCCSMKVLRAQICINIRLSLTPDQCTARGHHLMVSPSKSPSVNSARSLLGHRLDSPMCKALARRFVPVSHSPSDLRAWHSAETIEPSEAESERVASHTMAINRHSSACATSAPVFCVEKWHVSLQSAR